MKSNQSTSGRIDSDWNSNMKGPSSSLQKQITTLKWDQI